MKRLYLVGVLLLGACATTGTGTVALNTKARTQQIEMSCAASTTAIKALTAANVAGKLTLPQQKSVQQAIHTVAPICNAPTPPTLNDIEMQALVQAVVLLQTRATAL